MLNFDVRWSAFLGDVGKIDIPDIRKAVLTSRKAIPVIKVKDKIISLDKVACKAGDMLVANWINFLYYAWSFNATTYIDSTNTSRSCVDTTFDTDKSQIA